MNNKGVFYIVALVQMIAIAIGVFATAIHIDNKINGKDRQLKIAPEDKFSKQTLYER